MPQRLLFSSSSENFYLNIQASYQGIALAVALIPGNRFPLRGARPTSPTPNPPPPRTAPTPPGARVGTPESYRAAPDSSHSANGPPLSGSNASLRAPARSHRAPFRLSRSSPAISATTFHPAGGTRGARVWRAHFRFHFHSHFSARVRSRDAPATHATPLLHRCAPGIVWQNSPAPAGCRAMHIAGTRPAACWTNQAPARHNAASAGSSDAPATAGSPPAVPAAAVRAIQTRSAGRRVLPGLSSPPPPVRDRRSTPQ